MIIISQTNSNIISRTYSQHNEWRNFVFDKRKSCNFFSCSFYDGMKLHQCNTKEPIISATSVLQWNQLNEWTETEKAEVQGKVRRCPSMTEHGLSWCGLPRLAWLLESLGAIRPARLTDDNHLRTDVVTNTLKTRDEALGTLTFTTTSEIICTRMFTNTVQTAQR